MEKKKICEFCKENQNILEVKNELTKIYIVSLQKNKKLKDFYLKNKINGANFIEIRQKSDFNKISDGEIIYFLSSKDITNEYNGEIKKLGLSGCIKIVVSEKKLKNLNSVCYNYFKSCKDFKKTHRFLKELIECFSLPSLVGISYEDIKNIFIKSSQIKLKKYSGNLNEKDKIIADIKKDFNKINNCFFIVNGGEDITLNEIIDAADKIGRIFVFYIYGSRIEESLNNKIEISLFAGIKNRDDDISMGCRYFKKNGNIVGMIRSNGEIVNFSLYCDICGLRYGDREIIVNDLCEEEGFPYGDYCEECQLSMYEQGFVGEDKSIYILKKDVKVKKE